MSTLPGGPTVLIHPWDASLEPGEWQAWVGARERFGVLVVNNVDADQAPVAVPTHFTIDGEQLLVHLARPNPAWVHLESAAEVRMVLVGDYAYVPTSWRAADGARELDG